ISPGGGTIHGAGDSCNNVNGDVAVGFDVGIEFQGCGTPGGVFLLTTTFTMDAPTLTTSSFVDFAVRMQSVGPAPNGGDGSAKLYGSTFVCLTCELPPGDVIGAPEPSTFALLGGGLGVLLWLRRRAKA